MEESPILYRMMLLEEECSWNNSAQVGRIPMLAPLVQYEEPHTFDYKKQTGETSHVLCKTSWHSLVSLMSWTQLDMKFVRDRLGYAVCAHVHRDGDCMWL